MRKTVISTLFLLLIAATPVKAYECVLLNKDVFGTVSQISTQNGSMIVLYQTNIKLPITTKRLLDGSRVTGGVPGKIPLSFLFVDKTGHVRAISGFLLKYVTQPNTLPGKVEYRPNGYPVPPPGATDSLSPTPAYTLDTYVSFFLPPGMAYAEVTFPNSMIVEACIEPGDIIGGRFHFHRRH